VSGFFSVNFTYIPEFLFKLLRS